MTETRRFYLGLVQVKVHDGYTHTTLPDGKVVCGLHGEQPGQLEIAASLGCDVVRMNRHHDLLHSMLAHMVGLPCSPALAKVATGERGDLTDDLEEAAVLAIQRWLVAIGKDIV